MKNNEIEPEEIKTKRLEQEAKDRIEESVDYGDKRSFRQKRLDRQAEIMEARGYFDDY